MMYLIWLMSTPGAVTAGGSQVRWREVVEALDMARALGAEVAGRLNLRGSKLKTLSPTAVM